ncbi:hydrophobin 1 [Moniliophthora roreri MCA 2997]|uniref:Hydrophobin n=1 Tax=Moniliophthora roreri (strain MCA 2997) TaxID=1381753 RepID=V2X7M1_MONRO|nr:hydrophobin 1 [Moniliophthora roreri MCA 2997]KAI3601332.1 hydrophobin 1 [Moniliophthora roreri]
MLNKVLTVTSLATLAAATMPASQCTTLPIQCCNSVHNAWDPTASQLLGLLGILIQDMNVLVGISCTAISVIGIGGNSCTVHPLCCENNDFTPLIAIGCVPVDLSL